MDNLSTAQRSKLISRIQSKDTAPELELRRMLDAAGYRFRLHGALPESPDLVFSARHKVIFMNGCFWHRHDCPVGQHRPTSNTQYWNPKLDASIARDQGNRHDLETIGWESLTLWECEVKSMDNNLRRTASFLGPVRILPSRAAPPDLPKGIGLSTPTIGKPDTRIFANCPLHLKMIAKLLSTPGRRANNSFLLSSTVDGPDPQLLALRPAGRFPHRGNCGVRFNAQRDARRLHGVVNMLCTLVTVESLRATGCGTE